MKCGKGLVNKSAVESKELLLSIVGDFLEMERKAGRPAPPLASRRAAKNNLGDVKGW